MRSASARRPARAVASRRARRGRPRPARSHSRAASCRPALWRTPPSPPGGPSHAVARRPWRQLVGSAADRSTRAAPHPIHSPEAARAAPPSPPRARRSRARRPAAARARGRRSGGAAPRSAASAKSGQPSTGAPRRSCQIEVASTALDELADAGMPGPPSAGGTHAGPRGQVELELGVDAGRPAREDSRAYFPAGEPPDGAPRSPGGPDPLELRATLLTRASRTSISACTASIEQPQIGRADGRARRARRARSRHAGSPPSRPSHAASGSVRGQARSFGSRRASGPCGPGAARQQRRAARAQPPRRARGGALGARAAKHARCRSRSSQAARAPPRGPQ
jgi:hypothetical protein